MRKVCSVLIGIFFTLAFTTCKQFTANIEDYLSYWASEAFIKSASIEAVTQTDGTGIANVASEKDVTVTLKLQNPKSFKLVMPSASETRNIVHFEHFTEAKPAAGADYELKQLEGDTLQLIYKAGFLKKHEWGEKDLSSVITLIAEDGRVFKQAYTFKIKANTPPSKPDFTVAKTVGTPAYYVLCIAVPDMAQTVQGDALLHKDITRIEVNGIPYTFSVNGAQTSFVKPQDEKFLERAAVEKLAKPDAEEVPPGGWVLYYKTDVEVKDGAVKKEYTVRLADAQGLVSGILNASTKPNKAEAEQVRITKGTVSGSGNGDANNPVIIGTDSSGAELTISSATGGTTVHCTLTDTGSAASSQYNGNPVTVPLLLNGAGEKTYKLEYYTDGEGLAATAVKTVYYRVMEGHTVIFDADGGTPVPDAQTVLHGGKVADPSASVSKTGFYLDGWYTEDAHTHKWDFNTGTVTRNITLYAQWTAGAVSYKVEHYKEKLDETYPDTADVTEIKPGTTGQIAVYNQKTYEGFTYQSSLTEINGAVQPSGTINADGTTVVKLYYKRNTVSVTFNPNGGTIYGSGDNKTISGKYGAPLTAPTVEWTGHTFSGWNPPLPATPTFPAENAEYYAEWTLNSYTVTYMVDGAGGKIKAGLGSPTTNGTIPVTHNGSVTFTAVPDTGYEVDSWMGVTANMPNTTATLTVTAPTTVTVRFKKITYKVHFNKNDSNASGNMVDQSFTYGQSQNLTANGFTKTGYTFAGWATSADGNVQYTNQQSVSNLTTTANGTVDLYAKWTANTYKVHFNKNDSNASGNMVDQSFTYGQSQNLTANGFTKTGYTFAGWATSAGGNVQYTNQQSVSNLTAVANGTVDLYAKWTANTYTVTFSVADGKGGTLKANYGSNPSTATSATVQVTNGDSVSFTATPDEGWEFDRWTGVSSSSTTATLYNVTAPTTVTVKFKGGELNLAGGSGAWERLKKEAAKPDGAHTIIIDGEIKAEYGDDGEITLGRDLIIQGKDSSAVLHADQRSRIFHVQDNKTLTLKDITLKNGREVGSGGRGGGVLVESGATLIMKNSSITGCEAKRGGGVYVAGTFTIEGTSSITSCTTEHEGSGVYADGTFTMKGSSSIQACSTMGVYVSGTFNMQDSSSIQNCDDGVYVYGTFNMQGSSSIQNCEDGVYVYGTFNMKDGAEVVTNDEKNDVYLASGRSITVTGTLTKKPAARITPDSYTDGRVLATGAFAEKANFTVTPKNGSEHWRYKKKDGVIKFVPATLTVTFVEIKCVAEHDIGPSAEYFWQMKVNGQMISEIEDQSGQYWVAGDGDHKDIDASFTSKFNFFSSNETIPVNIEIWEDDGDGDDHIGTTDAKLMYHYNADAWQWGYRDSGHENGNQGVNVYKQINEGSANEVEFTEQYRHSKGDTDLTIRISWKE